MTTEKCKQCEHVEGVTSSPKLFHDITSLRRTYCIKLTSNEVIQHLKRKFNTSIDKLNEENSHTFKLVASEDVIDKIVHSIFDEEQYEKFPPCLGQYEGDIEPILTFIKINSLFAVHGKELPSFVTFKVIIDPDLSILKITTFEYNKEVTIGGIYLLRGQQPDSKTSNDKKKSSKDKKKDKKKKNDEDGKRREAIIDFIDHGSLNYEIVKDEKAFTTLDAFNDKFKEYQLHKKHKDYIVRQTDRDLLEKRGFEWVNIHICGDCITNQVKTCNCGSDKPRPKVSIITNLKIVKKEALSKLPFENEEREFMHFGDGHPFKSKESSSLESFSDHSSEDDDDDNGKLSASSSNESTTDEKVPSPKKRKRSESSADDGNADKPFKCLFEGCNYATETKENLRKHGERIMKGMGKPHMSREEVNEAYPAPNKKSKWVKRFKPNPSTTSTSTTTTTTMTTISDSF